MHLPLRPVFIGLALLPAAFAAIPSPILESGPTICLSRLLLSLECWGCGMTRALHRLLIGDWPAAIEFNPRVLPVAIILAFEWFRRLRSLSGGGDESQAE